MDLKKKQELLSQIKKGIEQGNPGSCKVENIGSIFFVYNGGACVLRSQVYYNSKKIGLDYEQMDMDTSYFVGSEEHAKKLAEALGGRAYPTEYLYVEAGRNLWVWEGPKRHDQMMGRERPLELEEVKDALF